MKPKKKKRKNRWKNLFNVQNSLEWCLLCSLPFHFPAELRQIVSSPRKKPFASFLHSFTLWIWNCHWCWGKNKYSAALTANGKKKSIFNLSSSAQAAQRAVSPTHFTVHSGSRKEQKVYSEKQHKVYRDSKKIWKELGWFESHGPV